MRSRHRKHRPHRQVDRGRAKERDTAKQYKRVVIRGWDIVRRRLLSKDPGMLEEEFCISLEDVPKLIRKMTPKFYYRSVDFVRSRHTDTFFLVGMSNSLTKYSVGDNGRYVLTETLSFPYPLHLVRFVTESNVFVGFNLERMLVVMNMVRGQPKELCQVEQLFNARCISVIPETGQLVIGGIGFLRIYSLTALKAFQTNQDSSLLQGHNIQTSIGREDWVVDVIVYAFNHTLMVVIDSGIVMLNYIDWRETHKLVDPAGGGFTCCCIDGTNSFLITGSRYGVIKVWSIAIKVTLHLFYGHRDSITAIVCHQNEPVVVSGSHDGTVFIWRLDTFRKFKQIIVSNGPVTRLNFSSHSDHDTLGFWCETESSFHFYELAEPYRMFSCMASAVVKLKRLMGHERYPNRILVATWDGGVWFKNPLTAETVGFMFPIITLKNVNQFAYDVIRQRLYVLLPSGGVLVLKCSKNPFRALEHLPPEYPDETVTSIVNIMLWFGTEEHSIYTVAIVIGMTNGQIELMESDNLHMNGPIQAHHGSVVCLETLTELVPLDASGCSADEGGGGCEQQQQQQQQQQMRCASSHRMLLSAGSDLCVKLWRLRLGAHEGLGFELLFLILLEIRLDKVPKYLACVDDRLAMAFNGDNTIEMYDIGDVALERPNVALRRKARVITHEERLAHDPDYDHTDTVTAVDKCALLKVFATASMDKTVKIWDDSNTLLRELVFEEPVVDMCFATDAGDILVGREFVLVYSSPEHYLPWSHLEKMLDKTFSKEKWETPKQVVDSDRAWVDPDRVFKIKRRRSRTIGPLNKSDRGKLEEGSGELEEWQMTWHNRGPVLGASSTLIVQVRVRRRKKRPKKEKTHEQHHQQHRHQQLQSLTAATEGLSKQHLLEGPGIKPELSLSVSAMEEQDIKLLRMPLEIPGICDTSKTTPKPPDNTRPPAIAERDRLSTLQEEEDPESFPCRQQQQQKASGSSAVDGISFQHSQLASSSCRAYSLDSKVLEDGTRQRRRSSCLPAEDIATLLDDILEVGTKPSDLQGKKDSVRLSVRCLDAFCTGDEKSSAHPPQDQEVDPVTSPLTKDQLLNSKAPTKFKYLQLTAKSVQSDTDLRSTSWCEADDVVSPRPGLGQGELDLSFQMESEVNLAPGVYTGRSSVTDSQAAVLVETNFRRYCQQSGCGPLGPMMGRPPAPAKSPSPCSSYADTEELDWHRRCMKIPQIPNSVILKEKRRGPPASLTHHQQFHNKVIEFLERIEIHRPPLFYKPRVPRPPRVIEEKKEPQSTTPRRQRKRVRYVQWNTLEEFAVIRRRMLPVYSTRLFPWKEDRWTRALSGGNTPLMPLSDTDLLAPPTRQPSTFRGDRRDPRSRLGITDSWMLLGSVSSTGVIMHTCMLQCMAEPWFPPHVERKPLTIFKTLLGLMSNMTQVDVLLEVCSYVAILCNEANLPEKMKTYAAYKAILLANHQNPRVRAAAINILPNAAPLNRVILQVVRDALKNENEELRKEAAVALERYGIKCQTSLMGALKQFNLYTHMDVEDEVFALGIIKTKIREAASTTEGKQNKRAMLRRYKKLFTTGSTSMEIRDLSSGQKKKASLETTEEVHLTPIATMKQARPEIRMPVFVGDPTAAQAPKKPFSTPLIPKKTSLGKTPSKDQLVKVLEHGKEGRARTTRTSQLSSLSDSPPPPPVRVSVQSQSALRPQKDQQQQQRESSVTAKQEEVSAKTCQDQRSQRSQPPGEEEGEEAPRREVKSRENRRLTTKPESGVVTSVKSRWSRLNKVVESFFIPVPPRPDHVVSKSDSRSSLHFLSTSDEDSDEELSDSSFVYQLPDRPGTKPARASRAPRPAGKAGGKKRVLSKPASKAAPTVAASPKKSIESKPTPFQLTTTSTITTTITATTATSITTRKSRRPPNVPVTRGCYWLPAEPGLRVHHRTVPRPPTSRPNTSTPTGPPPSRLHAVTPLTGRLGVATTSRQTGQTHYGALCLEWTTRTPVMPVGGVTKKMHRLQRQVQAGNTKPCLKQEVDRRQRPLHRRRLTPLPGLIPQRRDGGGGGRGGGGGGGGGVRDSQSLPFSTSLLIACLTPVPKPRGKSVDVNSLPTETASYGFPTPPLN